MEKKIFKLPDMFIGELREQNVIQVITDNGRN